MSAVMCSIIGLNPCRGGENSSLAVGAIVRDQIRELEKVYPGIIRSIGYFETLRLPACPLCNSPDTAMVMVGCVGLDKYRSRYHQGNVDRERAETRNAPVQHVQEVFRERQSANWGCK